MYVGIPDLAATTASHSNLHFVVCYHHHPFCMRRDGKASREITPFTGTFPAFIALSPSDFGGCLAREVANNYCVLQRTMATQGRGPYAGVEAKSVSAGLPVTQQNCMKLYDLYEVNEISAVLLAIPRSVIVSPTYSDHPCYCCTIIMM
jgi:hypothetical protein